MKQGGRYFHTCSFHVRAEEMTGIQSGRRLLVLSCPVIPMPLITLKNQVENTPRQASVTSETALILFEFSLAPDCISFELIKAPSHMLRHSPCHTYAHWVAYPKFHEWGLSWWAPHTALAGTGHAFSPPLCSPGRQDLTKDLPGCSYYLLTHNLKYIAKS